MNDALSVLVADDEELIRCKVKMMLEPHFQVREAATAAEAEEAVRTGDQDAILLDIVFPDGNGIELCRKIKAEDPHATVIISSSMESVDAWNDAFAAGADGYLEKRELQGLDHRKLALTVSNLAEKNRLKRRAEEASQRQTELLSVLSHDVRAPFQALLGTIGLLRKSDIPPEALENVETLHKCAVDQLQFINSLLEYLRLESGAVGLRNGAVDINLAVNQALQGLRVLAEGKDIEVVTELADDLPTVEGDIGHLCRVFTNLIGNAVKFTNRSGRVRIRTSTSEFHCGPAVEITISDNGVGITAEQAETLMQRFRRGRSAGTEGETGSGLGLAICKEIVQLHGGHIRLDPGEERGTVVTVQLPALSPDSRTPATCPENRAPRRVSHIPARTNPVSAHFAVT